jgi:hypothetical protein
MIKEILIFFFCKFETNNKESLKTYNIKVVDLDEIFPIVQGMPKTKFGIKNDGQMPILFYHVSYMPK